MCKDGNHIRPRTISVPKILKLCLLLYLYMTGKMVWSALWAYDNTLKTADGFLGGSLSVRMSGIFVIVEARYASHKRGIFEDAVRSEVPTHFPFSEF